MKAITVRYLTIKDPLGLARTAWYICENGKPTGYADSTELALEEQCEMATRRFKAAEYAAVLENGVYC